jgi:hypothetical protein
MKKIKIGALLFISATTTLLSQQAINSIENRQTELVVNDSIFLRKGSEIQVWLPAGKDFVFIKPKTSGLGTKLLGKVAGIAGTGAAAVGIGTGNIGVMQGAVKVMNSARAVQYSADAINQIQNLDISKNAKKIAGKKMTILDWNFQENGYIIVAEFDKKRYEIYLQEAAIAGEVKL